MPTTMGNPKSEHWAPHWEEEEEVEPFSCLGIEWAVVLGWGGHMPGEMGNPHSATQPGQGAGRAQAVCKQGAGRASTARQQDRHD